MLPAWMGRTRGILIDAHGGFLDPERNLERVVTADPALVAARLLDRVESWREAERTARAALDAVLDSSDEPTEPRAARDAAASLPNGSTLVAASSMPVRDLDRAMAPRHGLRTVGNRGASGIDGFVSTAMGIAMGTGGRTVALAGDLSMLHDSNGLTLTSGDRPDITFVVLNNDGGGIFSFLPQAKHESFELLFGTPHGLSFERLAALHRCSHVLVERASDLPRELRSEGVSIVEVRTDRKANVAVHGRMVEAVADALA